MVVDFDTLTEQTTIEDDHQVALQVTAGDPPRRMTLANLRAGIRRSFAALATGLNALTGNERVNYDALRNTPSAAAIAANLNALTGADRLNYDSLRNTPTGVSFFQDVPIDVWDPEPTAAITVAGRTINAMTFTNSTGQQAAVLVQVPTGLPTDTLKLALYSLATSTGGVRLQAGIAHWGDGDATPDAAALSFEALTRDYATANVLSRDVFTWSSPGVTNGEMLVVRLERLNTHADDTSSGACRIVGTILEWS